MNVASSAAAISTPSHEHLVAVNASNSQDMRDLFASVFGHLMTAQHWAWKYDQGRGHGVGLMRDGQMVAHYGGLKRPIAYMGTPQTACQVCDVMVQASANRALVRKGPLYQVAAAFLDAQVGHGRPHLVAFGFPSERHHQVAVHLGLYGQVDKFVQLSWPSVGPHDTAPRAARHLHREMLETCATAAGPALSAQAACAVQNLWQAMRPTFDTSIIGVRDAAWITQRYLRHPQHPQDPQDPQDPQHPYQLLLLRSRWWRRPVALLVLRKHASHAQLLDIVGPKRAFASAVYAARVWAAAENLPQLQTWVTQSHAHNLSCASGVPATPFDPQITLPTIVHTPGPGVQAQVDRWFLMAGDADFT